MFSDNLSREAKQKESASLNKGFCVTCASAFALRKASRKLAEDRRQLNYSFNFKFSSHFISFTYRFLKWVDKDRNTFFFQRSKGNYVIQKYPNIIPLFNEFPGLPRTSLLFNVKECFLSFRTASWSCRWGLVWDTR